MQRLRARKRSAGRQLVLVLAVVITAGACEPAAQFAHVGVLRVSHERFDALICVGEKVSGVGVRIATEGQQARTRPFLWQIAAIRPRDLFAVTIGRSARGFRLLTDQPIPMQRRLEIVVNPGDYEESTWFQPNRVPVSQVGWDLGSYSRRAFNDQVCHD